MRPHKTVADLSDLPTYAHGSPSPIWWGTLAFVALEGMGFALAIAAYLYLAMLAQGWPLGSPPPDLLPGSLATATMLVSVIPNMLASKWAHEEDLRKVRIGLVIMSVIGIALLVIRIFEFAGLQTWWDTNAYGSIIWFLLGLHTTHLLTDVGDTMVLAALMFTRHAKNARRFTDVSDNAFYWNFVVISWLLIYALIYWFPRI